MQIKGTYKEIFDIALPIILGSVAQSINQVIDMSFMGHVGEAEMGGVNLGGMLYILIVMICFGFTKGGQILVARKSGENDIRSIGNVFWHVVGIAAIMWVLMTLLAWAGSDYLLDLIVKHPLTLEKANTYFNIRLYGLLFSMMNAVLIAFYSGIGRTFILSISIIALTLVNFLLNCILVKGMFGFPPMGIAGTATATAIAEAFELLVMIGYLFYKGFVKEYYLYLKPIFSKILTKELLVMGAPLCFQYAFGLGSWFIFFLSVEKMGSEALAASSMLKVIYVFIGIPSWSLASAANTVASNIYGQRNYHDILPAIWRVVTVSFGLSLFFSLPLLLTPKLSFQLLTDQQHLIDIARPIVYVIFIALMIMSVAVILLNGIMGIGKTTFSFVVEIIGALLYITQIIVFIYYLKTSLLLAWTAEITYWVVSITFSLAFFYGGFWKKTWAKHENELDS